MLSLVTLEWYSFDFLIEYSIPLFNLGEHNIYKDVCVNYENI